MVIKSKVVYVVGAGLSAGLGFPTINSLTRAIWPELTANTANAIADIIRFHHPDFDPSLSGTFVNIERLLSEMQANEELFNSSSLLVRAGFSREELRERRQSFLLEMAAWFHKKQRAALKTTPPWLSQLVERMQAQNAQVISFNWDLVLAWTSRATGLATPVEASN